MGNRHSKIPMMARWILKKLKGYREDHGILGDMEEIYKSQLQTKGRISAFFWYWKQTLGALFLYISNSIRWGAVMFKNYIKIAFRNLMKHKAYSFINISGLAVGLACFMLIFLYIQYELSYDKFHRDADHIYRILLKIGDTFQGKNKFNIAPTPLAPELNKNFDDVAFAARVGADDGSVKFKEKIFHEEGILYGEPELLKIFTFPLTHGDPDTAISRPFTVLVSEDMALKYFGKEDPVGKLLKLKNRHDYEVTGVFKNIPDNSHLKFDFLASFQSRASIDGAERMNSWEGWQYQTYFKLHEKADPKGFEKKLQRFYEKHRKKGTINGIMIQPLKDIHFYNEALAEFEPNADIRNIYVFGAIGFFIILIACFNYMNLSTARSSLRSREVGVRKVIGATRMVLVRQFFSETTIVLLLALLLSILIVILVLPTFSAYVGMVPDFSVMMNIQFILCLLIAGLMVVLISGSYPALFLSAYQPAAIFKGTRFIGHRGSILLRNILVLFQFGVSVGLIFCTIVTSRQMSFIRNRELGFNKDFVLTVSGQNLVLPFETIKNELRENPNILDVTVSDRLLIDIGSANYGAWEGQKKGEKPVFYKNSVDYDFLTFYKMEIVEGRNFSRDFPSDLDHAYILNETAVNTIGWDEPVGKKFGLGKANGVVVGVMKDIHFAPLKLKIEPLVFMLTDKGGDWISLKIHPDHIGAGLAFLEKKWKDYSPEHPFGFGFLDEELVRMYAKERKLNDSFGYFTFITIFIAYLGLFGLATFTAERRTREVGIRKVLGASVFGIIFLHSKDFLKWVILANVIAWPIAYLVMNRWLQSFVYRMDIGLGPFALSGTIALLIAAGTISFQGLKAATVNPVATLKCD